MKVAILGAGRMGTALAGRLSKSGYEVTLASRPNYRDAVAATELAIVAVPWPHSLDAVRAAAPFGNRVLLDVTNPEDETWRELAIGHTSSGSEELARAAGDARVVKAFNYVYAELIDEPALVPTVVYCGDDADAKRVIGELIARCGFDALDGGPLTSARWIEPMAMLTVRLVREQGWGPSGITWRALRAPLSSTVSS